MSDRYDTDIFRLKIIYHFLTCERQTMFSALQEPHAGSAWFLLSEFRSSLCFQSLFIEIIFRSSFFGGKQLGRIFGQKSEILLKILFFRYTPSVDYDGENILTWKSECRVIGTFPAKLSSAELRI